MANIGYGFDANEVEPNAPREIIPAGDYPGQILNDEMKPTKSGGELLEIEIEITGGGQEGRRIYDRLNLVNKNEKAVEIANRKLSSICHATGVMALPDGDTSKLYGRPMMIKVGVEPRADRPGEYSNVVKGYKPVGSASASPAPSQGKPAAQTAAPATQADDANLLPWKRKRAA